MWASKLELSNELLKQESPIRKILEFLKANPERGHNTNAALLAKTIGASAFRPLKMSNFGIQQTIYSATQRGLIIRHSVGRRRYNFVVNYGHPDMPPDINEGMIKVSKRESLQKETPAQIMAKNGASLNRIIIDWMKEHPDELNDTAPASIGRKILGATGISANLNSFGVAIGRMVKSGYIRKEPSGHGRSNFSLTERSDDIPEGYSARVAHGGKMSEAILRWMKEHPEQLKNTNAMEITRRMIDTGYLKNIGKSTVSSIISRMVTFGEIYRTAVPDGVHKFDFGVPSGTVEAEAVEKIEEKQPVMEVVEPEPIELEVKENDMEKDEQTVTVPEGRVISLTININFTK